MKLILTTILALLFSCAIGQNCHLSGSVTNPEIKSIVLKKIDEDLRHDPFIEIPVTDRKFDFSFALPKPEVFVLMLGDAIDNGGGRFMPVFLQSGEYELVVNEEANFDRNFVSGKENALYASYVTDREAKFKPELKKLYREQDSLRQAGNYYSEAANKLREIRKANPQSLESENALKKLEELHLSKLDLTPAGLENDAKIDAIVASRAKHQREFMERNPSLAAYYLLLSDLYYGREAIDAEWAGKMNKKLSAAFPGHRYNQIVENLINSIESLKIGKPYVDFTAQIIDGKNIRFSEAIQTKIVLLDLWATWCSSCIEHTRQMIPVYEEFKHKGFSIIGVAGEFRNAKRLEEFLSYEKWPWPNLLEFERKNGIWQKYGADNGGGGLYLIADGKIIAINPSADEVRQELMRRL